MAAPVAEWLRPLNFTTLNCLSSHRCGVEPSSGHVRQAKFCLRVVPGQVVFSGISSFRPTKDWLSSKWVKWSWRAVKPKWFVCLCWGLTSQSTIFQSCRDGATTSWVINQYFRGVKCLAQGHSMAAVGFEPPTSRSGVRHSTTEPPRSPKPKWKNV